jgi:hypothetical protein
VIAPEKHVYDIYITVFKESISLAFTDQEKEELYNILRYGRKPIRAWPRLSLNNLRKAWLDPFEPTVGSRSSEFKSSLAQLASFRNVTYKPRLE